MRTRSGGCFVLPHSKIKKDKSWLTVHMLRGNNDHTPHRCKICLRKFKLVPIPEWCKCPMCADVTHSACFFKHLLATPTPKCLNCQTCITFDVNDTEELEKRWIIPSLQELTYD